MAKYKTIEKGSRSGKRVLKILDALGYVYEIIELKLREETKFTGQVDFTFHFKDGGIGNVEAHSRNRLKNGDGK